MNTLRGVSRCRKKAEKSIPPPFERGDKPQSLLFFFILPHRRAAGCNLSLRSSGVGAKRKERKMKPQNVQIITNVPLECGTVEKMLEEMPGHTVESMCRTIVNSANRFFEDESNRAEYEAWKKARQKAIA